MADQEKVPTIIPISSGARNKVLAEGKVLIVERLPNSEQPHPSTDGLPEGSAGLPGEHLEHEPIVDSGKVIAAPPGHGETVTTIPSEKEVERLLKASTEDSGSWFAKFFNRKKEREGQELPKAA